MVECVKLADIDEAISCADLDNVGGIVNMFIAMHADIATFPKYPVPTDSGTMDYATAGTWNGDFVMKSGKKFAKISFTDEGAELTFAEQGDSGNQNVLHTLNVRRNKIDSVIAGFMNAIRNRRLVVVAEDANGIKYVLGDERIPCRLTAGDNSTTGKGRSDVNQANLQFQYTAPRLLVYEGTLPVNDTIA